MEIKKFKNHYGLELISAPHEGIMLADLVWDALLGTPSFSHPGMPNTIYTAFLDAKIIDQDEFKEFQSECRETAFQEAYFPEKTIDVRSEFISELKHPSLGNLEGRFKMDSISKFAFNELKVREMNDLLRVKIDQYLEQMKSKRWKEYDGKIRNVCLITELYYGSIKLVVEKSLSGEFDTALEKAEISLSAKTEGSSSVEYAFHHENVPFAMRIEKVRSFNG